MRRHTSAYVSIRQRTYRSPQRPPLLRVLCIEGLVRARASVEVQSDLEHTSAYVSVRIDLLNVLRSEEYYA
jgi:hypothetical protein